MTKATRFTKAQPCPICAGYDEVPRGQGARCYGFLSEDGQWAHCTRDEYGGALKKSPKSDTYAHRLVGQCRCGVRHDPRPEEPRASRNGHQTKRQVATYDYMDEQGQVLYQVVRYREPNGNKTFRQRRPGKGPRRRRGVPQSVGFRDSPRRQGLHHRARP